jgi:hypothetical protein
MNAIAAVVLLGSLAATAWAQEPSGKGVSHEPTLDAYIAQSAKGVNFYSVQRERELGRDAVASLERCLHCATRRHTGEVRELSIHLHLHGL